jgi:hypothetical protein
MPHHLKIRNSLAGTILLFMLALVPVPAQTAHTWEVQEIVLHAAKPHPNAYKDVDAWVELKGPNFSKRVYGFWDGGNIWRVRVVATGPGKGRGTSDSS